MTSRPPSLSTIVRRALEGECSLTKGSSIIVAVSGGPDSMALLSTLGRLGPRMGLTVLAHGVDHGLRPEAAAELDLAERFATSLEVPWSQSRVSVPRGGNLQSRARDRRWEALVEVARRTNSAIATAHHADDRAETLLMRLLRGAGVRGLGVLPTRATAPGAADVTVLRPLLRAQRSDVLTHLERHGVPFAMDPSNEDPHYLRTRVRQTVLPLLKELDPSVVRHLEALADELVDVVDSPRHDGVSLPNRGAPGQPSEPEWAVVLPRQTREALRALQTTRSPRTRVWLPGGFVASIGETPKTTVAKPDKKRRAAT